MQSSFNGSYRDSQDLHWTSANIQRRWDTDPYSITDGRRKEQVQSKKTHSTNHLSANAICLCKWDAKNNTTKSCTICWNMLDAGGSVSTTGPLRNICLLPQEVAPVEPSHLPICPNRCLYGFLPMHTYLLCQTLSLGFISEQYLQWEICLQCGIGCLLLRLAHQSIESIRSHMQTLSQWV